ncbi:hypothetical protein GCM10022419_016430 [Nonomuraea rosea]|uniref:Site-specific integrase n=1 Tax=Nonomuraea rosea TaxID=638574 RepID=A0ABP6VP88_9ACTN
MSSKLRGSITTYQTKAGARWRVQMPPALDPLTGKEIRPTASFDTEEEAKEWRKSQNVELLLGIVTSNTTLGEAIVLRTKQAALKQSTVRNHLDDLKRLPDWFAGMKVSAVTQADALRWLKDDLIQRPLRRSTMLNVVTTVSAAFEYVTACGVRVGNPIRAVSARRVVLQNVFDDVYDDEEEIELDEEDALDDELFRRGPVWTPEQIRTFIDAQPYTYRAMYLAIVLNAVRRGEALGMQWESLNLAQSTIRLRKNITWARGHLVISPSPKNGKRRKVILDPMMLEALQEHKEVQDAEKGRFDTWEPENWIFTRPRWRRNDINWTPGTHLLPLTVSGRVNDMAVKFGFPTMGTHGLRRSWATIADGLGIPRRVRRDVLGHSTNVTDAYSKTTKQEILKALEMVRAEIFPDWKPRM